MRISLPHYVHYTISFFFTLTNYFAAVFLELLLTSIIAIFTLLKSEHRFS